MRGIGIVVFAAVVAVVCGITSVTHENADFLVRQKAILEVLQLVGQKTFYEQHSKVGAAYKIEDHLDDYTNKVAVQEFLVRWEQGMLPRGEVFSVFYDKQRDEAISLFHVFYYAKDWQTFYNTMVWARDHVNQGMFAYALTVAVLHRNDMQGIVLPPLYEITPQYFVNREVIQKAQQYKMSDFDNVEHLEGARTVVIPANYSGWYVQTNQEQKISYFTEDVGLNSYYFYFHADYPFWMGGDEFALKKDRRGELYMYTTQQLLARYYLERLSNGLGEIPTFSWSWPVKTGYYPSLRHANGLDFPARPDNFDLHTEDNVEDLQQVEDYERRIRDAIDYGFLIMPGNERVDLRKPEAIDSIGNLVQSNPDSYNTRYYRHLIRVAKHLLGNSQDTIEEDQLVPSALELFQTAMRDPVFYQLYKRVVQYYYQFKGHLNSYTKQELEFTGVKIASVQMDKLVTYFDKFDINLSNALRWSAKEWNQKEKVHNVVARQMRLNHQPFSFKIDVESDKAIDAVVRVFMGPKLDEWNREIDLDQNRENFVEVDEFMYKLGAGKTTIERRSQDFSTTVNDRTSTWDLYKKVVKATKSSAAQDTFTLDMSEGHNGFPDRLLLPKGWKQGLPVQFFFMVTPYHAPSAPRGTGYKQTVSAGVGSGARYLDTLPFGYPLDREIESETEFLTPNMYFKDVLIYHQEHHETKHV